MVLEEMIVHPRKRYGRIAAKAVDCLLREDCDKPHIPLYTLSVVADEAAREAGRKSELYESLFDYGELLPKGARCQWVGNGSGSLYSVLNPYCPASKDVPECRPMAGPFDCAVDMGPGTPPLLTDPREGACAHRD